MFSMRAVRSAQPVRNSFRRYATEGTSSGGGPNLPLLAAVAAASAAGGYYYYTQTSAVAETSGKIKAAVKPSGNTAFKGGDQGFIDLRLESVDTINHNTKKFRFALPEPDDVSGLPVASCLVTKYKGPEMEKPAIRPYTPTSDEGAVGYLDLIVKKYDGGPMSTHLHEMKPEQSLAFKGPIPKYPLATNQHSHVALIAGGTGITPMYQLMRKIFSDPEDRTKVSLVFCNVTEADILLKAELEELENTYPQRFRAFYVLDKPPEAWAGGAGHVTKELLKTVLPEPKQEGVKVFVCGPPGMYKAVSGGKKSPQDQGELSGILKELGYSPDQVFKF